MQSTVLPALTETLTAAERHAALDEATVRRLSAAFAAVPDPRGRHGRRYDLPFLLTCLVAGLLCNCNSTAAIGQWCAERRALLARSFPHQRHYTPTGATFRWLLARLPAADLEGALAAWVEATRPTRDREPVAFDGKTVRGARHDGHPGPHLLSVSTHTTQETLIQVRVDNKTNEIPVAQALLPHLPLRGRVVTADALHTQTALAQVVIDHGGAYLLCVKGNQPRLHDDLATHFAATPATALSAGATTTDRRRGRAETRTLHADAGPIVGYLLRYWAFPRLGQVARLVRTVRDRKGTRTETVSLLTSLTPRQADPARLLSLIRGHWSVESRHWTRDVTFGEDRSRLRCGHGPQIMATLRNLALTLIRRAGATAIAAYRRHLAIHPAKALRLIRPKIHSRR